MTFDQAVDAAKSGLVVTRPGFMEEYLGWDPERGRLYTIDRNQHRTIFTPLKADRESLDWTLLDATPPPFVKRN